MVEAENLAPKSGLSDYLFIIWKWRKFLIINTIIAGVIAIIVAFLMPTTYRATATVFSPPESSGGLSGLSSLINSKSSSSFGAKLLGVNNTSEDMLFGILNSRSTLVKVINQFDLIDYYEIKDKSMDKAIKAFSSDVAFSPNEFSMIEVSVINKNPRKAADIANFFIQILDSINIKINSEQAHNNRLFIEQRYQKNLADLRTSEDSMSSFQKKFGIFTLPDQFKAAIQMAGDLEAKLAEREIMANRIKQEYGEDSPRFQVVSREADDLKKKIVEINRSPELSYSSNVVFPFKKGSEIFMNYFRYARQLEIQTKILEFVLPVYEQAKLDEQKSLPTIAVLDKATPPEIKYGPKRTLIILGVVFVMFLFYICLAFIFERFRVVVGQGNQFDEYMQKRIASLTRFYRM